MMTTQAAINIIEENILLLNVHQRNAFLRSVLGEHAETAVRRYTDTMVGDLTKYANPERQVEILRANADFLERHINEPEDSKKEPCPA